VSPFKDLDLLHVVLLVTVVLLSACLFTVVPQDKITEEGVNQGRVELFTGQVICRQAPLQGTEIQLECKTRKEIEDLLRFIQPKSDIK